MEVESKDYSWAWVTASRRLSQGSCELIYAQTMSAGTEADSFLYDGENASGTPIVEFENGTKNGQLFSPKVPVYCRRGLYFAKGTNTIGIFVQWRELGQ